VPDLQKVAHDHEWSSCHLRRTASRRRQQRLPLLKINTDIGATELYARSKLAQILITRELAGRLDKGELGFAQSPSHRFVILHATHTGGVKSQQQD
jgi:hypothetical protein